MLLQLVRNNGLTGAVMDALVSDGQGSPRSIVMC